MSSNPEEVRKARDKVRSNLQDQPRSPAPNGMPDGTTPPPTRPDSPMSTMSAVEHADWAYARREAVIARLNGTDVDLDKIGDEDLERLYADIHKARSMRKGTSMGRPESRMSYLESVDERDDDEDDMSSPSHSLRPFSGSTYTTDDTSIGGSGLTLNGTNTVVDGRLKQVKDEMETQLETQRVEYEEKLHAMTQASVDVEDIKAERAQMEAKLQLVQTEMQVCVNTCLLHLRSLTAGQRQLGVQREQFARKVKKLKNAKAQVDLSDEDEVFTEEQTRLISRVLGQWRSQTRVSMAETLLSQAVLCKEANVIGRELGKHVTYQFTVVDRPPLGLPTSAIDSISGLSEFDDVSDPALTAAIKPCLAVKVIDHKNKAIYVWSLDKLQQRLAVMRNLYSFIDKPSYSQHLSWEDPFYDSSPPSHSYLGSALVSLAPPSRNLPIDTVAQIIPTYTEKPIASCRIQIIPVRIALPASSDNTQNGDTGSSSSVSPLPTGSKISFDIVVDRVVGFSSTDFSSVHCQLRLSSFSGTTETTDEIIPSSSVEPGSSETTVLEFRRTLVLSVTPELQRHLSSSMAPIDFFGQVRPNYLKKVEGWDESRSTRRPSQSSNGGQGNDHSDMFVGRLSESELVSEQKHDVVASVQIAELSADGRYTPVQLIAINSLDRGAFFLRQGIQRRIILNITHNSGRQWPWTRVSRVSLGEVRLLDSKGLLHGSWVQEPTILHASNKPVAEFRDDGTSSMSFVASWDSSTHNSPFLDRTTPSGSRALLRLGWEIEADNCEGPVVFNMDIAVTVQGRDARAPSKLMNLLSSSRVLSRTSALFAVRLTPFMTKRTSDIWRRDTSRTYVRGEESLGSWRPRGISLIDDRSKLVARGRQMAEVEATKAILAGIKQASSTNVSDEQELLRRALSLWQKRFGTKEDVSTRYFSKGKRRLHHQI
jgi:kinesin family protein 1